MGVRRDHGFTLLELAVTVAIVGILATVAYGLSRATYRNANLGSTAFDLQARLSGLRFSALSEQEEYVLVVIDAADATRCDGASTTHCGQYFVLRAPQSGFTLSGFSPSSPAANATLVESGVLPRGVKLFTSPSGAPPPPFSTVPFFGTDLTAKSGAWRFAIRFVRDGSVSGYPAGSASGPWSGYAFALTTDQHGQTAAADRKGVVVAFPAGIVRTFSVQ